MQSRSTSVVRVMSVLFTATQDTEDALLKTLRGLSVDILTLPGCTTCVLDRDVAGGPDFALHIGWVDALAMEAGMSAGPICMLLDAARALSAQTHFRFWVADLDPSEASGDLTRGQRAS